MPPAGLPDLPTAGPAEIRNAGATEVQRPAVPVADYLDHVGIIEISGRGRSGERCHVVVGVLDQMRGEPAERLGSDQGLIALNVEDHLRIPFASRVCDAVRAAGKVLGSHHDPAAETKNGIRDAGVIGQHDRFRDPSGALDLTIDPFDQRNAGDFEKRFAGESRRGVARRNSSDDLHCRFLADQALAGRWGGFLFSGCTT